MEELSAVRAELQQLPTHRLDDQFAVRVIAAARSSGASLSEASHSASRSRATVWHWPALGAGVAAVAAALVLATLAVRWSTSGDSVASHKTPQHAPMAEQLDRQLAQNRSSEATRPRADRQPQSGNPPRAAADPNGGDQPAIHANTDPVSSSPRPAMAADQPSEARSSATRRDGPGQGADPQQVVASGTALPGQINIAPGGLSQQISLVIDVTLTDDDQAVSHFERVLRDGGVAFDSNIQVEKDLEECLLASRYFEPAATAGEAAQCTVIFVVSPAARSTRSGRDCGRPPRILCGWTWTSRCSQQTPVYFVDCVS